MNVFIINGCICCLGLLFFINVNEMYLIMNFSLFKGEYLFGILIILFKWVLFLFENEFFKFNNRCFIIVFKISLGRMVSEIIVIERYIEIYFLNL